MSKQFAVLTILVGVLLFSNGVGFGGSCAPFSADSRLLSDGALDLFGGSTQWCYRPCPTPFPPPFGGQGTNGPMDVIANGSNVKFYANVTYNEWPEQNRDVTLQILDPQGQTMFVRVNRTDSNGIAVFSFAMDVEEPTPWGEWLARASADVAGNRVVDTVPFYCDYMVNVWNATPSRSEYEYGETATITFECGTRAMQNCSVFFLVEIKDPSGITLADSSFTTAVGGAAFDQYKNTTQTTDIHIPLGTGVTTATVYVTPYNDPPANGGVPLGPTFTSPDSLTIGVAHTPHVWISGVEGESVQMQGYPHVFVYGPVQNPANPNTSLIEYWCYFPYDDPRPLEDLRPDDWEPVYVEIDSRGEVLNVYSTAHCVWVSPTWTIPGLPDRQYDLLVDQRHPKIVFSHGSHTPYLPNSEDAFTAFLSTPNCSFLMEIGHDYQLSTLVVQDAENSMGLDPRCEHDIYNPFDRGLTLNELALDEALAKTAQFRVETLIDESTDYVKGGPWDALGIGVLSVVTTPVNTYGETRVLAGDSPDDLQTVGPGCWDCPPYKEIGVGQPLYLGIVLSSGDMYTKLRLSYGFTDSSSAATMGLFNCIFLQQYENTDPQDPSAPYFYTKPQYFWRPEMPLLFQTSGYYLIKVAGDAVQDCCVLVHVKEDPAQSYIVVSLRETQGKLYLHVYDSEGRHVGMNEASVELAIPSASYFNLSEGQTIIVLPTNVSDFQTVVDARYARGLFEYYTLTETLNTGAEVYRQSSRRVITPGETQTFRTEVTETGLGLQGNPPLAIRVLSPQDDRYYSSSVPLILDVSEHASWIGYSLDNELNVTIEGNTVINVEAGTHELILYANDTEGNWASSGTVNFGVDSSSYGQWQASFLGFGGNPITALTDYNGTLYAAAGGILYTYNGTEWNLIASPAHIVSLACHQNMLLLGGQGGLYLHNRTAISLIFPVTAYIRVLGVFNGTLYAGTFLDKQPTLYYCNGSVNNPSDWRRDAGFSAILNVSGPFGSIDSFAVYNDKMYVGCGETVYCYDGTGWSVTSIGYEYAEAYMDMAVYNGKLYMATKDKPNRCPAYEGGSGVSGAIVGFDGTNWTTFLGHDYWIFSLEVLDDKLYVGTADRIYTWNGTVWDVSFYSPEGAYYALSMTAFNNKIYAGMGNGYIFADPIADTRTPLTPLVPEFPSGTLLLLFLIVLAAITAVHKKVQKRKTCLYNHARLR